MAGGAATTMRAGHQPPVPLFIGPLAGHDQIGPGSAKRVDEAINVAAECAAVGRHRSRVNENPRRHDLSGSFRRLGGHARPADASLALDISRQVRAYALGHAHAPARWRTR